MLLHSNTVTGSNPTLATSTFTTVTTTGPCHQPRSPWSERILTRQLRVMLVPLHGAQDRQSSPQEAAGEKVALQVKCEDAGGKGVFDVVWRPRPILSTRTKNCTLPLCVTRASFHVELLSDQHDCACFGQQLVTRPSQASQFSHIAV
jgi:hypothetical protein